MTTISGQRYWDDFGPRALRLMCLGTSMTEGINSQPGWRGWFTRIMAMWGRSNFEFVGSRVTSTGVANAPDNLDSQWGERMYGHEAEGGLNLATLRARAEERIPQAIAAGGPLDVLVLEGGQNDASATLAQITDRYVAYYRAAAAVSGTGIMLCVGVYPIKALGSPYIDGAVINVLTAQRRAFETVRAEHPGRFLYIDVMREAQEAYFAHGTRADWHHAGDNTHWLLGQYRAALLKARALVGVARIPRFDPVPVREVQYGTSAVGDTSGGPVIDFVTTPADVDVPMGAFVSKTDASTVMQVLTVGGSLVTIGAGDLGANVQYPVPIVRLYRHNGGSTLSAGKICVRPVRIGTWL